LEIILFLSRQESCVCSAVVDQLDLAQSTVSQHLKALKQAGIIRGTISGTQVCYCLDPEIWAQIRLGWNTLFDRCAPQLLCCPVDEPK
jgi:DNA-binding IclR family transcriptional regulator